MKYKIGSTNRVIDCLIRPLVAALITVLDSCVHETSGWPQLYETDLNFATTYQMLGANLVVTNFHLQNGLLCLPGHICIPSSERDKMIWEAHYKWVAWHFNIEKIVGVLQKHFYSLNFDMMSTSISGPTQPVLFPNQPLRNKACTALFLLLTGRGNSSQWTTCQASHIPSGDYVFVVVDCFSKMVILVAWKKSITTEATTKLFFEQVLVHFGIPHTIVSYQENWFLNTF